MTQKDIFKQFLSERFPNSRDAILEKFERFHAWLVKENQKINLISRQTATEDIWTVHFLDSLLSTKYVDFGGGKILDFGTGGGLPGIPLAIVCNNAEVTLLDSRKKKINAVRGAAKYLELDNCAFWDTRLEETGRQYQQTFDFIVSRSVKIEPAYAPLLKKLLAPQGKIVLYKGINLDDVRQFENAQIFDAGIPELGVRRIAVI
jgi:16S rRNA (guanine527-N7)-methyltransferase